MSFGDKLKELMKKKDLNQTALRKKTNISQSLISKYINNDNIPDLDNINRLSKALGVRNLELIDAIDQEDKKKRRYEKISNEDDVIINVCLNTKCPGLQFEHKKIEEEKIRGIIFPFRDKSGDPINYCHYCGQKLVSKCWYCDKPMKDVKSRYCYFCGASLYLTCFDCDQVLEIKLEYPAGLEEGKLIDRSASIYKNIQVLLEKHYVMYALLPFPKKDISTYRMQLNSPEAMKEQEDEHLNVFIYEDKEELSWCRNSFPIRAGCPICEQTDQFDLDYFIAADLRTYVYHFR